MEFDKTYTGKIFEALIRLKENESLNKEDFINKNWPNGYNHFTHRSFDVSFHKAKKLCKGMQFRSNGGEIKRIKEIDFSKPNLDLKSAILVLERHNAWRLGEEINMLHPKITTQAIEFAIDVLRGLNKN